MGAVAVYIRVLCVSALCFSTPVTSFPVPLAEFWEVSGRGWDSRIPLLDLPALGARDNSCF